MIFLSPDRDAPSGKTIRRFMVHKVFCRLSGSPGIFLLEILPSKEDRGAAFQDTGIDTGVGQIRQVLELNQFQVGGDYHGCQRRKTSAPSHTRCCAPHPNHQ